MPVAEALVLCPRSIRPAPYPILEKKPWIALTLAIMAAVSGAVTFRPKAADKAEDHHGVVKMLMETAAAVTTAVTAAGRLAVSVS